MDIVNKDICSKIIDMDFYSYFLLQVKFFDFLNKAQIKAAKQISNALSKEETSGVCKF